MLRPRNRWISAARIIEYPQANLFDRSICFLVWATLASFWKLSRSVCMRQTINFNEINVSNRHVYYPVNTCVRIALTSSLIDGFSRINCRLWCIQKASKTPLYYGSATALPQLYYRPYIVAHTIVCTNGSTSSLRTALQRLYNGSAMALQMALQRLYKRLCNGSMNGFMNGFAWLCNGFINGFVTAL